MTFSINPLFSDAVKRGFTFHTPSNDHGYDASVVMIPKKDTWRLYYRIDMLSCGLIVCTVRDRAYNRLETIVTFSGCQHGQIEIERAELYRNGSNYPYRVETHSRYMGKYEEIACFVYGAIMGGLLVSQNATEMTETTTCDNLPTTPETRPQSATETAETPASDTERTEATRGSATHARETANGETTQASALQRYPATLARMPHNARNAGEPIQCTTPRNKTPSRGCYSFARFPHDFRAGKSEKRPVGISVGFMVERPNSLLLGE